MRRLPRAGRRGERRRRQRRLTRDVRARRCRAGERPPRAGRRGVACYISRRFPGRAVARAPPPFRHRSADASMKIHEYQGKEILARFGIPVPRGYPAFSVREATEAAQKLGGSVWVVKAQIHAGGRGKGGGVKLARSRGRSRHARRPDPRHAARHPPDRARRGRRCAASSIEEGADIKKEYYVAVLTDRATQKVAMMGSSEGGMDIEKVAHDTPEKIVRVFIDPIDGMGDAAAARARRRHRHPEGSPGAGDRRAEEALRLLHGDRRVAGRDQPADPRGRQERRADAHQGARREVQLRLERDLPPPRDRRLPRPRRGRPGRDRGEQVRPRLHPARRQHRLPRQRRRPGDGDDGHDQAVRRRAGELPRRRRRRLGREGHRGVQDHAAATRR